jgi:prolyl-tRNA synthetase
LADEAGADKPMIMGCYGVGIDRTVAAAIEQNHDKDGIVWARPLAPFEVLLISLNPEDEAVKRTAEEIY